MGILLFLLLLSTISYRHPVCSRRSSRSKISRAGLPLGVSTESDKRSRVGCPTCVCTFTRSNDYSTDLGVASGTRVRVGLPPTQCAVITVTNLKRRCVIPGSPDLSSMVIVGRGGEDSHTLVVNASAIAVTGGGGVSISMALCCTMSLIGVDLRSVPTGIGGIDLRVSPLCSSLSFAERCSNGSGDARVVYRSRPNKV